LCRSLRLRHNARKGRAAENRRYQAAAFYAGQPAGAFVFPSIPACLLRRKAALPDLH